MFRSSGVVGLMDGVTLTNDGKASATLSLLFPTHSPACLPSNLPFKRLFNHLSGFQVFCVKLSTQTGRLQALV
jgi:hypothetical protein